KAFTAFKLFPSYSNFFIMKILKEELTSNDIFEIAIKKHLMVRDCSTIEGLNGEYIRFSILTPTENDKLLKVFEEIDGAIG
ncbi:MAG: hypothetical protein ACK5LL_14545, partial [Suipraeoptans sp.]